MFDRAEDDNYTNEPENIRILKQVIYLYKGSSLLEPLKNGCGVAYERDYEKEKWRKIEDWKQEE